jgi:hypothetical protein
MPSLSTRDLMMIVMTKLKIAVEDAINSRGFVKVVAVVVILSVWPLSGMLAVLFFIPLPSFGFTYWERYLVDALNDADRE